MECIYCGNPLVADLKPGSWTSVAKLIKKIGDAELASPHAVPVDLNTYKISCDFCRKKYSLIAMSMPVADLLRYVRYLDPLPDQMEKLGIDITDIENGFRGIAVPDTFAGRVWNTKEFHILSEIGGRTYCMYCYRLENAVAAVNLERIEVTL
jgi:hypothetical protein